MDMLDNKKISAMSDIGTVKKRKQPVFLKLSRNEEPPVAPNVPETVYPELPIEPAAEQIVMPEFSENKFKPQPNAVINFLSSDVKISKPFKAREIGAFALAAIVIVFGFQSARIIASGISTKATVLGTTSAALSHLKEAESLVQQKDFLGAEEQFQFAQQNFMHAQKDVADLGVVVNSVLKLTPQGKSANSLLEAGQQLSDAGLDLNNFYALISQVKITPLGFETPDGFYQTINASRKYLDSASRNLSDAKENLDDVDPKDLPQKYQADFVKYKETLNVAEDASKQISSLLQLFQQFIGGGQKTFLALFQNNNELRPTGGFIGTYGFFKTNNGKITSQKISSIYDLDGQIKESIAAPGAMYEIAQSWALRDSNWFADFAQSAMKASNFYEKEAGETPDAVFAVTPDLFVDLLKITGPIYFPKYNLTLNAENFRSEVQLNTSVLYDKAENTPKQMLADFAPLMLQKLGEMPEGTKTDLLSVLFKNIFQKNVLFYDRNTNVQKQLEAYNWAGRINSNDSDYLAIYNANLHGTKNDLDIKQNMDLKTEVQADGRIVNTLTYTRNYERSLVPQEANQDYVRFLVPLGSKLISATGFNSKPYHASDGVNSLVPGTYRVDSDLAAIDKKTSVDNQSGTVIAEESGKTSFGNWVVVGPGEKAQVEIKYALPFKADSSKHFSLLVQKQPGNNQISMNYSLISKKRIAWYTPSSLSLKDGAVKFSQDLTQDSFIGVVFDDK
jgi:hypothetical protein